MDLILREQAESLRQQMVSAPPDPLAKEGPSTQTLPPWMKHLPRRFRPS